MAAVEVVGVAVVVLRADIPVFVLFEKSDEKKI